MSDWLSTLLAVSGSGSLVGIAIAAVMRALPYLAKARSDNAQTKATRAQTRKAEAEARRAEAEARAADAAARRRNDEVTATQVTTWLEELRETVRQLKQRVEDAERRAEEAERKAEECERRNGSIIKALRAELEELRRSIGRRDWTDPPPLMTEVDDDISSARIEVVHRAKGDDR